MLEQWLDPWFGIDDAHDRQVLEAELRLELCEGHELTGLPLRILAKNDDDVLVALEHGENGRVAEVHMTYSQRRETIPGLPSTMIFQSIGEWRQQRMIPDHEDFIQSGGYGLDDQGNVKKSEGT